MNFSTICQVALAKILMKGHDILSSFTHFAIQVFEEEGVWTVTFQAEAGYDSLSIDIKSFDAEDEAYAWLANGRLSTRSINKAIVEYHLFEEAADIFAEELLEAGEEDFLMVDQVVPGILMDGEPVIRRTWDWDAIGERSPFFEHFLGNEIRGDETIRINTLAEVKRLRTLLAKRHQ